MSTMGGGMNAAGGGMNAAGGGMNAAGSGTNVAGGSGRRADRRRGVDDRDPCSPEAMRDEIRANARTERALIGIGLISLAASAAVLVLRGTVA
ncbi:hypothetical protein [Cellulomonas edaphi]|uniref:Uncharacterized protein n=1 Tax=Cellulomonas edaphi TaxID=3053468 RepID=A0ABT7S9L5_9CELL|nr:hypothetical protein [Cellulomons edaphi]MDM7832318.1 hypothetical protein [Cellulomons edaphi]